MEKSEIVARFTNLIQNIKTTTELVSSSISVNKGHPTGASKTLSLAFSRSALPFEKFFKSCPDPALDFLILSCFPESTNGVSSCNKTKPRSSLPPLRALSKLITDSFVNYQEHEKMFDNISELISLCKHKFRINQSFCVNYSPS